MRNRLHRQINAVAASLLAFGAVWIAAAAEPEHGAAPGADGVQVGPLTAVETAMESAAEEMAQGRSGERVQRTHEEIVASLDRLIAAAENTAQGGPGGEAEQGRPGQGDGRPGGASGTKPQAPAQESTVPGGQWTGSAPGGRGSPGVGWMASLPPAEREQVQQAFKSGRLPWRYQDLVRQYSKALSEGAF